MRRPRRARARWKRSRRAARGRSCSTSSMPDLDGREVAARLRARRRRHADLHPLRPRRGRRPRGRACRRAPTTTWSSRSRWRSSWRACMRCCAAARRDGGWLLVVGDLRVDPARRHASRGGGAARAHPPRVRPARGLRPPPGPGALARRSCSSRCGATTGRPRQRRRRVRRLPAPQARGGGEPRMLHTVRGVGFVLRPWSLPRSLGRGSRSRRSSRWPSPASRPARPSWPPSSATAGRPLTPDLRARVARIAPAPCGNDIGGRSGRATARPRGPSACSSAAAPRPGRYNGEVVQRAAMSRPTRRRCPTATGPTPSASGHEALATMPLGGGLERGGRDAPGAACASC